MNDVMNLQQIMYSFLVNQIEFGACRFGHSLPTIEEAGLWFSVSPDTVRRVYLRLEREGYITLTKKVGAAVAVEYSAQEIEQHIQIFFSLRRDSVMDLCRALVPMFSHVQWFSLKNASPEQLNLLEHICARRNILPTHKMIRQVQLIYSTPNNDLLRRLIWRMFLFLQGSFISLPQKITVSEIGDSYLIRMIELCRKKDWDELWRLIEKSHIQFTSAIRQFYEEKIIMDPPGEQIAFYWNAYEKSSQYRYSLAIELLKDIRHGVYSEETFLPSPSELAEARKVSVITIRRTLALLNQLGATQSVNGIGTRVLKTEDSIKYCDFSQPSLQKRLLDFAQSLQILTLTCKGVSEITLASMKEGDIERWIERLLTLKQIGRHESVVFACLEIITQSAPVRSVKEVYMQLLQILLWGYPLRGMHGSKKDVNEYYLPYIDAVIDCLKRHDDKGLGAWLEILLRHEVEFAATYLKKLGISRVFSLVIPEAGQ